MTMNRRAFILGSTALVAPGAASASCPREFAGEKISELAQKFESVTARDAIKTAVVFGGVTAFTAAVLPALGVSVGASIAVGITVGTAAAAAPYIAKTQNRALEMLEASLDTVFEGG